MLSACTRRVLPPPLPPTTTSLTVSLTVSLTMSLTMSSILLQSSKEDADLAYSTYLLTSNAIAQGCAPGDSAAPAAAPPAWDGQV